ncbi:cytochrome c [Rhizobium petrolearium]|uniref:Cytochrome c family protein n=2 Tax=Neorhizobium TaxID=1525371 RepID=A0ABV0M1Y2_9HYPH|nr:cytochrome c family protein [Neorhizobium petrolearium]MBP1842914.1 cytochrome c [Neorhizobium petrolearium]MCC2611946.1 cytochrome c family protein [Neorhizobium petrolearium]WGI67107.1 cytochrome c family protein [Neorhizobium petrolearium]
MKYQILLIGVSVAIFSACGVNAQEGDANAGATVFNKCKACHDAETDKNKVGPSLNGVIGRVAGTHAGFAYSKAMVEAGKAGLQWDEASLRDYLHNPKAKVKGTKMAFAGLKDEGEISNLLAYLEQFSKKQ